MLSNDTHTFSLRVTRDTLQKPGALADKSNLHVGNPHLNLFSITKNDEKKTEKEGVTKIMLNQDEVGKGF